MPNLFRASSELTVRRPTLCLIANYVVRRACVRV